MSVDSSRVIDESVFGKKEEIIPLRGPVVNKCFLRLLLYPKVSLSLVTLVMEWRACGHKTKCNATANVSSLFLPHFSPSSSQSSEYSSRAYREKSTATVISCQLSNDDNENNLATHSQVYD